MRDITFSPILLDFTTSNWNVAQAFTLRAAEDGDDLAGTCTFNHLAAGAEYNGLRKDVIATEGENDSRGFKLSRSGPITMDEGGTATYTI